MSRCAEVLERIAAVSPRGVVAEMCSLKGHLAGLAEKLRSGGMRLVSFHPMFGPDVRMLSGRTVVFCTEARDEDLALVRRLFERTSARLVDMDITEHDRRMGLVLGLTHLTNLVFARALERSGVSAQSTAEVAGVTYHKQIVTTQEVTAENPQLYFEIQALNQAGGEMGQLLRDSLDEWLAATRGGSEAFATVMEDCQRHFEAE
jgi:chorismate mutase/prephenate dehydrogenase